MARAYGDGGRSRAGPALDSHLVDSQVEKLLFGSLKGAFSVGPTLPSFFHKFSLEIRALLCAACFAATTGRGEPTEGMKIMGLKISVGGGKGKFLARVMLLLCNVLLPYLSSRLRSRAERVSREQHFFERPTDNFFEALKKLDGVVRVLSSLNFVAFLLESDYLTLPHRLLSARLVEDSRGGVGSAGGSRSGMSDNLTRRLFWDAAVNLFLALSPMSSAFNVADFGRRITSFLTWRLSKVGPSFPSSDGYGVTKCGICRSDEISIPYVSVSCGCVYCYACVMGKMPTGEERWTCGVCGVKCTGISRKHGI